MHWKVVPLHYQAQLLHLYRASAELRRCLLGVSEYLVAFGFERFSIANDVR